jgi:hypothetical protein
MQLTTISNIHVRFSPIPLDQKMCDGIPLIAKFAEEVPCAANPLDEGGIEAKSNQLLGIYLHIGRQAVTDVVLLALLPNPFADTICSFVHLPCAKQSVERACCGQCLPIECIVWSERNSLHNPTKRA